MGLHYHHDWSCVRRQIRVHKYQSIGEWFFRFPENEARPAREKLWSHQVRTLAKYCLAKSLKGKRLASHNVGTVFTVQHWTIAYLCNAKRDKRIILNTSNEFTSPNDSASITMLWWVKRKGESQIWCAPPLQFELIITQVARVQQASYLAHAIDAIVVG